MSFLPHGSPSALSWYGSFVGSFVAHAGLVSFVLFSGVIVLIPLPPEPEEDAAITVSLEILDANIVEELEPVDDTNLVPEDAVVTEPDAPDAETPEDLAALSPDEQELLAPEEDTLLAPEEDALQPELEAAEPDVLEPEPLEPEVTEPEVLEPEVVEPEPVEPEVAEPEVIEPEPVEPEVAEVLPEPENEPLLVPEEVVEPEPEVVAPEPTEPEVAEVPDLPEPTPLPEPEPETPLAIDDLSPIDDTVLNPLASGGSGPAPVEDDVLALVAPEPDVPEVPVLEPEVVEEIDPVALPEEVIEEPEVAPEEAVETPEPEPTPEPEVVEETPEPVEEPEVAAAPPAPARQPLANPTASDVAIGQLLRRIRATPQEQCTLALPRRFTGDGALAGLSMVGAREEQLDALAERIVSGLDFAPVQTRELLDPRQCATLDALRQSESYPANRIGLSLDTTTLASGDTLTGRVIGAGGLYVTLLLVDDNGVVQDLAQFVTLDGSTPVFEVPVARAGPSRATRQVLLAIGTEGTPLDLSDRIGREAQDVFGPIPAATLREMVFGVATVDVQ